MILLIDTSGRVARVNLIADGESLAEREWEGKSELDKTILEEIDRLLREQSVPWQAIDRIAVHRGKENSSFMALRIGIMTATMLAESLGKQLVSVSGESMEMMIQEVVENEEVQVIQPKYTRGAGGVIFAKPS